MEYPKNLTNHFLNNFIAKTFTIDGVPCFYGIDGKFDARNNLSLEDFKLIKENKFDELNIKKSDGTLWKSKPIKSSELIACSMNHSNIFCIDIDENIKWTDIPSLLHFCPFTKSRTKSLPHFFFRISDIPNDFKIESTKPYKAFQNKSDNLNFCKGELLTGNVWEKKGGLIYNWNGDLPEFKWNEIKQFLKQEEVIKFENKMKQKQPILSFKNIDNEDTSSEDSSELGDTIQTQPLPQKQKQEMSEIDIETKVNEIRQLSTLWNNKRLDSYSSWITFTYVIQNELGEQGIDIWDEISKQNSKYNAIENFKSWTSCLKTKQSKTKKVTIGTFKLWAMQDNPTKYETLYGVKAIEKNDEYNILEKAFSGQDYLFADAFTKLYETQFKYSEHSDTYFSLDKNNLWIKDNGSKIRITLSEDYYNKFKRIIFDMTTQISNMEDADLKANQQKKLDEIIMSTNKLLSRANKNLILKEIADKIKDNEFEKNVNRSKFLIPMKNGKVIDIRTNEIRNIEPNDKFTFLCDAEYLENPNQEKMLETEKYFMDLFKGNMETMTCVINIIKSIIQGNPLRYVYFATGTGCNGKSLFFKILNSIFGDFMDTISRNVIVKPKSNSHLNTEVEKLDKCRIGFVSELKDDEELNQTLIKQITGGDKIDLRTIQKTNSTIEATANLVIATNQLPKFDGQDEATIKRIIVIPFNNKFPVDTTFESKIMELKNEIFTYIINKGKIIDGDMELSDEMKLATQNYAKENDNDYLKEYITSNYDFLSEPLSGKDTRIMKVDDFRIRFNAWLKEMEYPQDKRTKTTFTKHLTKLGVINKESNSIRKIYNLEEKVDEE